MWRVSKQNPKNYVFLVSSKRNQEKSIQQYNLTQYRYNSKMDTIFMNLKKSEACDLHGLTRNVSDKTSLTLCGLSFFTNRRRLMRGPMDPKYKFWCLSNLQRWIFYRVQISILPFSWYGILGNWDHLFSIFGSLNQTRWKSYFISFFFKTLAQSMIILEGYRLI